MDIDKKKAGEVGKAFVQGWGEIHATCPEHAMITLLGSFGVIWGMMMPEERSEVLRSFISMAIDVGNNRFEDGADFVAYLKEKRESV
jgi:hypothetical protein